MKKLTIILATTFFLISSFVIPTTVLSGRDDGPTKPKEWKGEGTKIEFPSMPTLTIRDFFTRKNSRKKSNNLGNIEFSR